MAGRNWVLAAAVAMASWCNPAAAQISDGVVRIGIVNDQSGVYADTAGAGSVAAARLAIEDFGPTVLGARIDIVTGDHQNKADVGSAIVRKWYDSEGVDLALDFANSAVSLAAQGLARERGKMIIHVGSALDRLYGADCAPTGFLWLYDTYTVAQGIGKAIVADGGDTWFFISADYAFGQAMEGQMSSTVTKLGAKVLGAVRHPVGTMDYSAYVLQAQTSGAKVIGLANAGVDTINTIKQAAEFGVTQGGQKLAGTIFYIQTVHGLGLQTAQGLRVLEGFYWDRNDASRAFAERFKKATGGAMPSQIQAGVYSATLAYLRAVQAAGTDEGKAVSAKMKELPVDDFFAEGAKVRADGRLMNDMFLLEVKKPAESTKPWDYYKVISRLKAADIIRPLAEGGCPFVAK